MLPPPHAAPDLRHTFLATIRTGERILYQLSSRHWSFNFGLWRGFRLARNSAQAPKPSGEESSAAIWRGIQCRCLARNPVQVSGEVSAHHLAR